MIEVFPFGDEAFPMITLDRTNFMNATELVLQSIGGEFRKTTNYAAAVKTVREYYFNDRCRRTVKLQCPEPHPKSIIVGD